MIPAPALNLVGVLETHNEIAYVDGLTAMMAGNPPCKRWFRFASISVPNHSPSALKDRLKHPPQVAPSIGENATWLPPGCPLGSLVAPSNPTVASTLVGDTASGGWGAFLVSR